MRIDRKSPFFRVELPQPPRLSLRDAYMGGFLYLPMSKSYYRKKSLSYEEQADKAISRGLFADRSELIAKLQCVSYYRLSGYWYSFRRDDEAQQGRKLNEFMPGTSFDDVWERYRFDRKLRFLFLDAIDRIEIALRTKLVHYFTQDPEKGPFGYVKKEHFPKWKEHKKTIKKLEYQSGFKSERRDRQGKRNDKRDAFINSFLQKYCNAHLPFWMLAELMDFGSMSRFIECGDYKIKQAIAKDFNLPLDVFLSWMSCLNSLRNACAHHSRIWNKVWGLKPLIPSYPRQKEWRFVYSDDDGAWIDPTQRVVNENNISCAFLQKKTAILFLICRYFLKSIISVSQWNARMEDLLNEFCGDNIRVYDLGLPEHWKEHPLWK